MFNQHFFRRFSSASQYDIDIDFSNDEIYDIDFSQNVVMQYLDDIDINKAQGPDNISGVVLKKCSKALCQPLSLIFQLIYNTGLIPHQWKLANIVPVFKKGDNKDVSNYRRTSLTCLTAKAMERIVYEKILCRTENLIDSRQHGFLRNKSCSTNMISLTESHSVSLLSKVPTDIIYFDFAKAFDSVCHDLILKKLKNQFGIDGRLLKFLKNYLQNRKQKVVLDNHISDTVDVLSGVPQGSIIGPLLFVLFINDIYNNLDKGTNVALYADDIKMWRQIDSHRDCKILQKDITALNEWCIQNRMKFHPDKCKVLTVSNNETPLFIEVLPFTTIFYLIGQNIIDYTDSQKDLGIYINTKLDWTEHQTFILNKAHQMLGLTKRTCHFINDLRKRRSLYLTLVRSNFEHCSVVWRPCYSTDITKFESLQKKAVKWINKEEFSHYGDEKCLHKCKELDILPLDLHFKLNDLLFFHKVIHNTIPVSLPEYIKKYTGNSRLRSRYLDSLSYVYDSNVTQLHKNNKSSVFYRSLYFRVIHIWNSIPLNIKEVPSIIAFKIKAREFLWQQLQDSLRFNLLYNYKPRIISISFHTFSLLE